MFNRTPADFKRKLQVFVDDFHAHRHSEAKLAAFKSAFSELSVSDQNTLHLNLKTLTSDTACDTPNLLKTGVSFFVLVFLCTKLGAYMNSLRTTPIPGEHLVDTNLEVFLFSLFMLFVVRYYHQDNFENKHNKPAYVAALAIFDEVRQAREPVDECNLDDYIPGKSMS